jgi:hypothetical protein
MAAHQPQCAVCPYEWSERSCRHDHGKAPVNCPSIKEMQRALQGANVSLPAGNLIDSNVTSVPAYPPCGAFMCFSFRFSLIILLSWYMPS